VLVSALPGPLGALTAQSSAARGPWAGVRLGVAIGLGQMVHATLASFAAFDLERIPASARRTAAVAMALLFVALAWRAWTQGAPDVEAERRRARGTLLGVFALALATPGTLPGYLLAFTALGLRGAHGSLEVVLGAFAGSLLWWSLVSLLAWRLRRVLTERPRLFARACGALFLLGAFGALGAAMR
jgi:threonine/homoserine/homoserine lactone efflux protein